MHPVSHLPRADALIVGRGLGVVCAAHATVSPMSVHRRASCWLHLCVVLEECYADPKWVPPTKTTSKQVNADSTYPLRCRPGAGPPMARAKFEFEFEFDYDRDHELTA